jgi:hypothetical protein
MKISNENTRNPIQPFIELSFFRNGSVNNTRLMPKVFLRNSDETLKEAS